MSVRPVRAPGSPRAHLDSPRNIDATRLSASGIEVQGWVDPALTDARIAVRAGGKVTLHPRAERRPDVVTAVRPELASASGSADCGFHFHVPWQQGSVEVGVATGEELHWLWSIEPVVLRKVLEGADDWLFLDNDSNRSVDQYTGQFLMEERHLCTWTNYFTGISDWCSAAGVPWAFLLAPAKEYVLGDKFPHGRAAVTPVDQFLDRFGSYPLVWPADRLSTQREACYWRGDTHWTDLGGAFAAEMILARLGVDAPIDLGGLRFRYAHHAGDLGGKFTPKRLNGVFEVEPPLIGHQLVFDNGIHNHGRVRRYRAANAALDKRCLVLGDSFSVNVAPWLGTVFSDVVFVHTAAAYDMPLLSYFSPDFLVLQSNSRFITTPPAPGFSLKELVARKMGMPVEDPAEIEYLSLVDKSSSH